MAEAVVKIYRCKSVHRHASIYAAAFRLIHDETHFNNKTVAI